MIQTKENTGKFTGIADIYSKYRPYYAEKFLDYIIAQNSLDAGSKIADIGSGTGILSSQLLNWGFKVYSVEPNADMRKAAESELGGLPRFISINGLAEDTGIEQHSIDLVTAAQAFHWFDKEKFKNECRRILKPGGKVVLVWNSRVKRSPVNVENSKILKKLCPNFKGFSGGAGEKPEVFRSFYRDGKYERRIFRNDLKYDLEGFIGRNLSASYAPREGDPVRTEFIEQISGLFDKYSEGGYIIIPNVTRSYSGEV